MSSGSTIPPEVQAAVQNVQDAVTALSASAAQAIADAKNVAAVQASAMQAVNQAQSTAAQSEATHQAAVKTVNDDLAALTALFTSEINAADTQTTPAPSDTGTTPPPQ